MKLLLLLIEAAAAVVFVVALSRVVRERADRRVRRFGRWRREESVRSIGSRQFVVIEAVRGPDRLELGRVVVARPDFDLKLYEARNAAAERVLALNQDRNR